MNRNPFRTTNLVFTPSNVPGIADIELVTEDQYPWRVYAGVDNTGINPSGANRWYGGFNWGNAFGLDHIFTYQFTSGSSYNDFWAHTVNYTAPLSWRHTLDLYGGFSKVRSAVPATLGTFTHGVSAQASLRYEIPLPSRSSFLEEFTWGFDWKLTNTNLFDGTEVFFNNTVNLTQVMVNYNAGLETEYSKNSATLEIFYSPGRWLPGQTVADFSSLRAGARNAYVYSRVALASIVRMVKNFTFEPTIRAQISSCNLLSSEQFSLGGYSTIRGYEEREVNTDNAVILNAEIRTPGFSPIWFSDWWKRHVHDELKFLYFMDYGYGHNHKLAFGEPTFQWLWGTGFGLRYASPKYFSVRADYAFRLHNLKLTNVINRPHMFYFGVTASY
jgi:hemolysin activation/secretion protein